MLSKGFPTNPGDLAVSLPAETGWVRLTARDQASGGTDAPSRGAKKHPAERYRDRQGRPEANGMVEEESYDPIVPVKVGNRGRTGTHWREGGNKRTYR